MKIILASTFLLSACGVPRQAPPPILVPTPVHCVTGDVPDEPRRVQGELTGDSGLDLGIISGSAIELRAWGRALLGIVNACHGGTAPAPQ